MKLKQQLGSGVFVSLLLVVLGACTTARAQRENGRTYRMQELTAQAARVKALYLADVVSLDELVEYWSAEATVAGVDPTVFVLKEMSLEDLLQVDVSGRAIPVAEPPPMSSTFTGDTTFHQPEVPDDDPDFCEDKAIQDAYEADLAYWEAYYEMYSWFNPDVWGE